MAYDHDFGQIKCTLNEADRFYEPIQICEMNCSAWAPGKFTVHIIHSDDIIMWISNYGNLRGTQKLSTETQSKSVPWSRKQEFSISNLMEFQYDSFLKRLWQVNSLKASRKHSS